MDTEQLTKEQIEAKVSKIKHWHHCLDLGQGVFTKQGKEKKFFLKQQNWILESFPESFIGKTVLDIGAWDGFYSFIAEKRGAKTVLATDSFIWEQKEIHGLDQNFWLDFGAGKQGFELSRRLLSSQVQDRNIDVLDITPTKIGKFDIVLFLGVLYHMKHPLLALEKVASVTQELLILETYINPWLSLINKSMMMFYPHTELNQDITNWCGPNISMVKSWLTTVGFNQVKLIKWRKDRAIFHAWDKKD